jgi:hypothetical protein
METVPEPVPDRTTINGRGAGPHADADADVQTRAYGSGSGLTSSTRGLRQETHNEDDNPGYPTGGAGGAEEGYAEVEATAWTTCVFLFLKTFAFRGLFWLDGAWCELFAFRVRSASVSESSFIAK